MTRTRRRQPTNREAKAQRLEIEWEKRMAAEEKSRALSPVSLPIPPTVEKSQVLPPAVEAIRSEAEEIFNTRERAARQPYSVQGPATDAPMDVGGGLIWWTGGTISTYIPVAEYGTDERVKDLRAFTLIAPFILAAESALTKKVQALQWTIEGGRNAAIKWQKRLNNFENGDGWDFFIARWIRAYCESDKMACVELIRNAPSWAVRDVSGVMVLTPRGERAIENGQDRAWEIVDARVMDPIGIFPTMSKEFPLIYQNPITGARRQLRSYNYMTLIDMPAVDDSLPGLGVCAVSRAVYAAQEDRMTTRYSMEKMSENPGAGIVLINAPTTMVETAINSAKTERQARGVVYYKGLILLPIMDPSGSSKLEFLSFSGLPEGFSRSETYNIIKERVATAFGLDILELGSIPGRLGTATQAKVAAQKGRTKTMGALMQGIERSFRYKLLPENITFSIKKHDQEEEMQRAEIDAIYFENAIRYAQFAIDPLLPTQYLADKGALPNEPPYVIVDLRAREEVMDVAVDTEPEDPEAEGAAPAATTAEAVGPEGAAEADIVKWEPRVRITRKGVMTYLEPLTFKQIQQFQPRVAGPLPTLNPDITQGDIAHATSVWDRLLPDYQGLLDAELG